MSHLWWDVVGYLGTTIYWLYLGTTLFLNRAHDGWRGWLRRWTFRGRWLLVGLGTALNVASNVAQDYKNWAAALVAGILLALCALDRYDDDDDWKRKKQRAKDAVKAVAGKLVVVPAAAPAR